MLLWAFGLDCYVLFLRVFELGVEVPSGFLGGMLGELNMVGIYA